MMILHQDTRATIDIVAARLDGVTYPLAAIASVETRVIEPRNGCLSASCYIAFGIVSLGVLAFGTLAIQEWSSHHFESARENAISFSVLSIVALSFYAAARLFSDVRKYALVISTSAGERTALAATDQRYIGELRMAIEQALVAAKMADAGMMQRTNPP